jgi:hypothetical protein
MVSGRIRSATAEVGSRSATFGADSALTFLDSVFAIPFCLPLAVPSSALWALVSLFSRSCGLNDLHRNTRVKDSAHN